MKKILSLALCLMALSPFSISALGCGCFDLSLSCPYISVWGGANVPSSYDFGYNSNNVKTGWFVGGALGGHFSENVRGELSFDYLRNSVSDPSRIYQQYVGLANIYYDFKPFECFLPCWTPYVGAGIGYAYLDFEKAPGCHKEIENNALAFQLGGGLRYQINCNMSASLSYRLLGITRGQSGWNSLFGLALTREF